MDKLIEEARRKLIVEFYDSNREQGKAFTVKYFTLMEIARSTIYDGISRIENRDLLDRKPGSGRKRSKMSEKKRKLLEEEEVGKVGQTLKKKKKSDHTKTKVCP
ncbi:hypothetical protein ILUMI_26542 [Ignelater luminosus]|uniref:Uncharacterized protein n=1 Tax=Ignelater luminosus TaxID=2038154 RepID=A0A8K0FZ10_IGNLU|nr:hypothetical protein ILUMI_26542 [Ignelater luminosus]